MRKAAKWVLGGAVAAGLLVALGAWDRRVERETAGTVAPARIEAASLRAREAATGGEGDDQILFGDLHVHPTFSMVAFVWALPMMHGPGARPPADACDYALHRVIQHIFAHGALQAVPRKHAKRFLFQPKPDY